MQSNFNFVDINPILILLILKQRHFNFIIKQPLWLHRIVLNLWEQTDRIFSGDSTHYIPI